MRTQYPSIRRHGTNHQYQNPADLPFAPSRPVWAETGVEYFAGVEAGGRRCPACPDFISTTSHVVAVDGRWRHARCATKTPPPRVAFAESQSTPAAGSATLSRRVYVQRGARSHQLNFRFDPEIIAALKAAKTRGAWAKWDSGDRAWIVPCEIWPAVLSRLEALGDVEVIE